MAMKGTYTRWTASNERLLADILGSRISIEAVPSTGQTILTVGSESIEMDADEARMIGVRLIEGAALADAGRTVRLQA